MSEAAVARRHYFTLRGALLGQQRLPWQLSDAERGELEAAVAREERLVARALATPVPSLPLPAAAEIEAAAQEFIAGLASAGDTEQLLVQAGLDRASLATAIGDELRAAAILDRLTTAAAPDEQEVRLWFERHREQFVVPERREAFHILITVNEAYAENRRDNARRRMDELAARLQAAPEEFATLVQRHSECPTAVEGGRLGVVPRGHLYPELEAPLFALAEGACSGVVESPLGFHLLRCGAIEAARALAWEEVRESLTRRLTERQRKRQLQSWLTGMQ